MELKVVCGCGQKYKFDVEPVNGRMPVKVACPSCGADGTDAANDILAQRFPHPPPPIPVAVAVPAVPAVGLRLNRAAPAPTAVNAPLPASSASGVVAPLRAAAVAPGSPKSKAADNYSLGLGILGAVVGAALGAGLMYGFFLLTAARFPLMGTCIGLLAGLGARILARGTDTTLGIFAGVVALLSTAGTLYLMFGDVAATFVISMAVSVFFAYKIAG